MWHMTFRALILACSVAASLVWGCGYNNAPDPAPVSDTSVAAPASQPPAPPPPASENTPTPPPPQGPKKIFTGITIHLDEKYVDLEGAVCLREGLLELVATMPSAKEHEAIVALRVRPSQVHAALLMLGLKPGTPGRWIYEDDKAIAVDPTGDRVKLALRWQRDGRWVEKPINQFIRHKQSDEHLESDEFVFAGSRVYQPEDGGEPTYLADDTGDLASLVSFETEVLALPRAASNDNAHVFWTADPKTIPELGTPVVLRIRPVK